MDGILLNSFIQTIQTQKIISYHSPLSFHCQIKWNKTRRKFNFHKIMAIKRRKRIQKCTILIKIRSVGSHIFTWHRNFFVEILRMGFVCIKWVEFNLKGEFFDKRAEYLLVILLLPAIFHNTSLSNNVTHTLRFSEWNPLKFLKGNSLTCTSLTHYKAQFKQFLTLNLNT